MNLIVLFYEIFHTEAIKINSLSSVHGTQTQHTPTHLYRKNTSGSKLRGPRTDVAIITKASKNWISEKR